MLINSYAIGQVWHKRYIPKIHEFKYKLNSWLINISDIDKLDKISPLVSVQHFNLYTFNQDRYIRDDVGSLFMKIHNKLAELGAVLDGQEKIFMLCQLQNLGVYFSPLNLYLCMLGNECKYVLAEVSNTPWNERYYYLIDMQNEPHIIQKNFHVSPFWSINQDYHWYFEINKTNLYFQIDNYQDDKKVFSAGYKVIFVPFTSKLANTKLILKQPFSIFKIIVAIYYEAFKIYIKKVPFISYQGSR